MWISKSGRAVVVGVGLSLFAAAGYGQTAPDTNTQTQSQAQAAQSASASSEAEANEAAETITIFGRKRRPGDPTRTTIATHTADSCGFMSPYSPLNEDISQDYIQSFYGSDANITPVPEVDENDPNQPGNHFKDTAPFGDASQNNAANANTLQGLKVGEGGAQNPDAQGGPCDPSDKAFAAGRNFIARNDTSLKEAYAAFDAKAYAKALTLFSKSYDKMGYDAAALMEGKMYLAGMGMQADTAQAIIWLEKVATARFSPDDVQRFNPDDPNYMNPRVDATMTLANIYMTGHGVAKNPKLAVHWFMEADEFGFIPATHMVGEIYQSGFGGEKNPAKAAARFKKAATAGYAPSMYALGELYRQGGEGVARDDKLGAQWLLEAAKRGHPGALYAVGNMYDLGDTLPHDPQKAAVYYKEAALKGQADAQNALGLLFYTGEVVGQDMAMARQWFRAAAAQGDTDAMFNLGAMLANGQGGEKNLSLAYVWLKLAQMSGADKAAGALAALEPKMTADEHSKAEAILHPPKT